ncbi:unnamed protein product [Urochloa decumbens]|uniref:Uncharacterized protein n=1 Tax=Urochloa decumbens TaxID=240449 RepID=A0ABC9CTS9_9POAL
MHAGLQRHAGPAAEAEAEAAPAPAGSLWMDVSGHHPPPFRLILLPSSAFPSLLRSRPHRHKSWHRSRFAGSQLRRRAGSEPLPLAQAIDVRAMNGHSREADMDSERERDGGGGWRMDHSVTGWKTRGQGAETRRVIFNCQPFSKSKHPQRDFRDTAARLV